MLVLLDPFFPNNPEFKSEKDFFLDLISELENCEVPKKSFAKSISIEEVNDLQVSEIGRYIENSGVDLFVFEYESMKKEKKNLVNFCTNFYTDINMNYCKEGKMTNSVQSIIYDMIEWEIRLKRMIELLNPVFNVTDGYNKRTNKSYRLIKGYWIDDDNKRKRIFNKNVGITEGAIEHHYERFFKNRGYEVMMQIQLSSGFRPDLIIEKNNKQSIVEFKVRNKEEFYNQFMNLEMWYKYCEIYKSI